MQRAMETPYVVRSHAASQTHTEQPCWTFSHPHPASEAAPSDSRMDTTSDRHGSDSSPSARAAANIDNNRHVHLSFRHDPTHGASAGCGYGALDPEVESVVAASQSPKADVALTVHGFLGSFHSVLYDSAEENEEEGQAPSASVISIAPNSFSVGMFSWFPLVSASLELGHFSFNCTFFACIWPLQCSHNPLCTQT